MVPVVRALQDLGEDVTILVTGPFGRSLLPSGTRVVQLPTLAPTEPSPDESALPARRAAVAWIDRMRPRAFWVDSSHAMTLAATLTGTPVVSTLHPGMREDEPHRLGCRASDELLAAWPPGAHEATVARSGGKVSEIGGVSRFEYRDPGQRVRHRRPRVVHLNGSSPDGDHRFWRAVRSTCDAADWLELGGPDGDWREDPWPDLCSADVVVAGAGQSSVADAACADVPLVVVPERDPFGEQDATAVALEGAAGASVHRYGDGPSVVARAVRRQLERAREEKPGGIRSWWGVDGAASRAAELLRSAAATTARAGI